MPLDFSQFEYFTFDCYGTIIDWETGILEALKPVLERHRVALHDQDILEAYAKFEAEVEQGPYQPYKSVLRTVLTEFGETYAFRPDENELQTFSRSVEHWPPFPDATMALHRLQWRHKLVILSNIDDDLFEQSARKLQVDFDRVFTAEQIGSYKPAPANFEYAVDKLGGRKDKILHVAQSLFHDIKPAKEIGLKTVWVNRRGGQSGFGATPAAKATPDLEVPDLASLAEMAG